MGLELYNLVKYAHNKRGYFFLNNSFSYYLMVLWVTLLCIAVQRVLQLAILLHSVYSNQVILFL